MPVLNESSSEAEIENILHFVGAREASKQDIDSEGGDSTAWDRQEDRTPRSLLPYSPHLLTGKYFMLQTVILEN